MTDERILEMLGWRAIAIITADDPAEGVDLVRSRFIAWMFRPPEAADVDRLVEQAKDAAARLGMVAAGGR